MSRKDTLIVAVLINTGLLLVLFATAMRDDDTDLASKAQKPVPSVMETSEDFALLPREALPSAPVDEVDLVISQWDAPPSLTQPSSQPSVVTLYDRDIPSKNAMPAPQLAEKSSSDYIEVTVKKGDVLERIARTNGTTVQEIMKANHLASSRLRIGQILKVPRSAPKSNKSSVETAPKTTESHSSKEYYTMKKGDSLWTIAGKYHTSVDELLRLNHLNEEKARRLKPGDQIIIR